MVRSPHPLQWPAGTERTPPTERRWSRFGNRGQVGVLNAAKDLYHELEMLGGNNIVITSQLPTRQDGLPYGDGKTGEPGIAVYFTMGGIERSFACDSWITAGENLHAIALSVGAMRGLSRWGVADAVERAFAGFAALPPGSSGTIDDAPVKRPWRDVLGGESAWPELDAEELLVLARARHRKLIQQHHPDRGGDHEIAADLNAALTEAESELTS